MFHLDTWIFALAAVAVGVAAGWRLARGRRAAPVISAAPAPTAPAALNEDKLRALLENLPFACWAQNQENRYTLFNRRAREMFGDHFLGKTLAECSHFIRPECLATWQAHDRRALAGETIDYDYTYVVNGCTRHLHSVIAPVTVDQRVIGVIGTAVDVSARVESEQARRAADHKLSLHTRQTPLGLIECDLSFKVLNWNPAAEAIFGLPAAEIVGQNALERLFRSEERREVESNWQQLLQGRGQRQTEHTFTRADGKARLCEWHHTPLVDDHGQVVGKAAFIQDITARAQLESQLRRVQRRDSLGQMAGGLAHELKNLFTPALIHLDILEQEIGAARPASEQVRPLRKALTQAVELSQRMLSLGKTPEREPSTWQALNPHVQDTVELLRRALDPRLRVIVLLSPDLRPLPFPSTAVTQVVMNLLLNARDALLTKLGDGPAEWNPLIRVTTSALSAAPQAIEGQPAPAARECQCIEVSDTGIGMDEATRQRVFEPFFTTKEAGSGVGLGLALAWKSTQSLGGWIEVESTPGEGARFRVFLPSPPPPQEATVASSPSASIQAPPAELPLGTAREPSRHVLLAEDDALVSRALTLGLQRAGHRVTCATDGAAALALIRLEPTLYDVVVTDLHMPSLGGRDLLAVCMRESLTVPIIVLSGHITSLILDELQSMGAAQVLRKPLRIEDLKNAVQEVLTERAQPAS